MSQPSPAAVIEHLAEIRIVSEPTLEMLRSRKHESAQTLLKGLLKRCDLTRFQAKAVLQGKAAKLDLGDYLITDQIGRGAHCAVYRAVHRRLERPAAIKLMDPGAIDNPRSRERFLREAKAFARLNHPNVVSIYDATHVGDRFFLAMELVEGTDLQQFVAKFGPMGVDAAVDAVRQAAEGLRHAHSQGILHRDVKPSNIVLESNGLVRLLDLGVARVMPGPAASLAKSGEGAKELTQTGSIIGTVDYMAPEQAFDITSADERADLYSLGATLFFLLTGRAMFAGPTALKILMEHQHAERPRLADARADAPAPLDSVFARMIAVRPDDRFRTAGDLVRELEKLPSVDADATGPGSAVAAAGRLASDAETTDTGADTKPGSLSIDSTSVATFDSTFDPERREVLGRYERGGPLATAGRWLGTLALLGGSVAAVMWAFGYFEPDPLPPTPVRAAVPPEPPDGTVRLLFDRPGRIEALTIDGQAFGREQWAQQITLDPGTHRLVVDGPEIESMEREFKVTSKKNTTLRIALPRDPDLPRIGVGGEDDEGEGELVREFSIGG